MRSILFGMVALLMVVGCGAKTAQSANNVAKKKPSIKWCKDNVEELGDGVMMFSMPPKEADICMAIMDNALTSEKEEAVSSLDLSKFGVKKSYTINEGRDVKILKDILKKIYTYQRYTSDNTKYNRDDVHENIAPYIELLSRIGQNVTLEEVAKYGYDMKHFVLIDDRVYVRGDCETTYLAIETFAIEAGINPQRIYEVYCDVMQEDLVTPAGGHMFGFYVGASGKNYTLEQLPYFRNLKTLYDDNHYRYNELRRSDKPIRDFKKFKKELLDDILAGRPTKVHPTNEVK